MIACRTLYNQTRLVPVEQLIIRPAAYAIIVHDDKALLLRSGETGKWMQPGGGIDKGETNEEALRRELREEAGIEIEIGRLAHFELDFFYYDPLDMAFQGYLFFYYCTALTLDFNPPNTPDEEGVPAWVNIHDLTADAIQTHGELIMRLIHAARG